MQLMNVKHGFFDMNAEGESGIHYSPHVTVCHIISIFTAGTTAETGFILMGRHVKLLWGTTPPF